MVTLVSFHFSSSHFLNLMLTHVKELIKKSKCERLFNSWKVKILHVNIIFLIFMWKKNKNYHKFSSRSVRGFWIGSSTGVVMEFQKNRKLIVELYQNLCKWNKKSCYKMKILIKFLELSHYGVFKWFWVNQTFVVIH